MIKRIFILVFFIFSTIAIWLGYKLFFAEKWEAYTEKRVKKSIVENYSLNKPHFKNLLQYISNFESIEDLSFNGGDKIVCTIRSDSINIENNNNNTGLILRDINQADSVVFLSKNEIKVYFFDTTITSNCNWSWHFEGNPATFGYQIILKRLNMNMQQLDTVKTMLHQIGCEAITLTDKMLWLKFDGFGSCEYDYVMGSKSVYLENNFTQLDSNVSCGIIRHEMICGPCIWRK